MRILAGVATGLKALFDHGLAHRDLKPGNVMFASNGVPMLMDFGSATPVTIELGSHKEAAKWEDFIAENCSMAYRAPELFHLSEGSKITEAADLWVGIYMLTYSHW